MSLLTRLEGRLPALITLIAFASWEASVHLGWISALFFPAPSSILQTMAKQALEGTLFHPALATLGRLVPGFLLGGLLGFLLGVPMGRSSRLRRIIDPFISALYPIPKISILPLVMIIFGIGEASKLVLITITAFFPVLINTLAGVRQIDPVHLEVAQHFGAKSHRLWRRVIIPASMPSIFAGIRIAFNTALIVTISVELLTANEGLGATIWLAWQTLRIEELYVALLITALFGIISNHLLVVLTDRVIKW